VTRLHIFCYPLRNASAWKCIGYGKWGIGFVRCSSVAGEHCRDSDGCDGGGSSRRRGDRELRERVRQVRERGGRGGGRRRGRVQQRRRRSGPRGAGRRRRRHQEDAFAEVRRGWMQHGREEAAASKDQLQLGRATWRRVPTRDQGALGQVQRPRHGDDHHEDRPVSDACRSAETRGYRGKVSLCGTLDAKNALSHAEQIRWDICRGRRDKNLLWYSKVFRGNFHQKNFPNLFANRIYNLNILYSIKIFKSAVCSTGIRKGAYNHTVKNRMLIITFFTCPRKSTLNFKLK